MEDFLVNIIQTFNLSEPMLYSDSIIYLEGTCGWTDAFKTACKKHNMYDVFVYYDELDWYCSDLFDDELGSLLYVDDMNSSIYFSLENAAPIANEFQNILQKYYKRFKDEANIRRAAELRRELEKLENIG